MAYAEKLVKSWRACWKATDGTPKKKSGFATKKQALDHAREQELETKKTRRRPDADTITLAEWVQSEWLDSIDLTPNSVRNYESILANHVLPNWGHYTFEELETAAPRVKAWEKKLRKDGYAESTVVGVVWLLSRLCLDAIDAKLMGSNPAEARRGRGKVSDRRREQSVRRQEKNQKITDPFGALVIAERAAALTGRDEDFVLLIATFYLGTRISETMALEIGNIGSKVSLQHQLNPGPKAGSFYWTEPKDGSRRTMDAPPFLENLLRWQANTVSHPPIEGPVCPCGDRLPEEHRDEYRHAPRITLFSGPDGSPHWPQQSFRSQVYGPAARGVFLPTDARFWRPVYQSLREDGSEPRPFDWESGLKGKARKDAAVACWRPITPEGDGPHDLRHSHKALLDELGTPKPLADERMGHTDSSTSARYSHPTEKMRADLVAGLEGAWSESLEQRRQLGTDSPVALVRELLEPGSDLHSRSAPDPGHRLRIASRGIVA